MTTTQQPYEDGVPDPEGGQIGQNGAYEQEQAAAPAPTGAAAKKKRAYAGQAYEFGAGANAALGGQQAGGTQYPGSAPNVGGYGYPGQQAQQQQQQPSYGMPQQPQYGDAHLQNQGVQPAYGQPQYGASQGGYEPPQQAYPAQGATGMLNQGIQGVQQQFQQMNIGGQQQPQQQQPPPQMMRLNPLQPVDISMQGQPFHVTDLDQSPPPIILPPNVSGITA